MEDGQQAKQWAGLDLHSRWSNKQIDTFMPNLLILNPIAHRMAKTT